MHIVCVSASNIQHARHYSTSTKACALVESMMREKVGDAVTFDTICLVDHNLLPCSGCGQCYNRERCAHDPVFNALYQRIMQADALFIVAAHYAPIPARLCMLLEKIEQLAFLPRFNDETRRSPLYRRPVGIIGHNGGTAEQVRYYKGPVLDTIANALSWPVEMDIVSGGPDWPTGVIFPVHKVSHDPASIFPIQEYDWTDIRCRIEPLVDNVLQRLV